MCSLDSFPSSLLNSNSTSNLTLTNNSSQAWTPLEMFFALILGLILLTTIAANSLILYLFVKSKRTLRSPTHWLIANLALADFSVGAFVMPILISVSFNDFHWHWGDFLCRCNEYFHFALCATSLLSMMSIAIERYIGVKFPLRHKRILTKPRIIKVIVITWILAVAFTASPLSIWPYIGERQEGCCPVNTRPDFVLFISLSVYFVPVLIISLMYWLTYKLAVKLSIPEDLSKAPQANLASFDSSLSYMNCKHFNPNKITAKSDQEKYLERKAKQTYLAKKLSLVVGIMLTLYAPLFIIFFTSGLTGKPISNKILLTVAWLRYFCSTLNPFLYIFVVPGYKRAFLKNLFNLTSSLNNTNNETSESSPQTDSLVANNNKLRHNKKTYDYENKKRNKNNIGSDSGYPSRSDS